LRARRLSKEAEDSLELRPDGSRKDAPETTRQERSLDWADQKDGSVMRDDGTSKDAPITSRRGSSTHRCSMLNSSRRGSALESSRRGSAESSRGGSALESSRRGLTARSRRPSAEEVGDDAGSSPALVRQAAVSVGIDLARENLQNARTRDLARENLQNIKKLEAENQKLRQMLKQANIDLPPPSSSAPTWTSPAQLPPPQANIAVPTTPQPAHATVQAAKTAAGTSFGAAFSRGGVVGAGLERWRMRSARALTGAMDPAPGSSAANAVSAPAAEPKPSVSAAPSASAAPSDPKGLQAEATSERRTDDLAV